MASWTDFGVISEYKYILKILHTVSDTEHQVKLFSTVICNFPYDAHIFYIHI